MQTIKLIDQIKASRMLYDKILEDIESIDSDVELSRVLGVASASTVARVLGVASDSTVTRVLGVASASTVARVLGIASASTVARVLGVASDSTVDRVLGVASDSTVTRVLGVASASTVARVSKLIAADVPIIPDLDKRVAQAVSEHGIDMRQWHCGTTHCRAGWAITLAGEAGAKLERAVGSEVAGRLIYEASTGRIAPDFFASNEEAMADIRRCAEQA
jgi:hypothetical protein